MPDRKSPNKRLNMNTVVGVSLNYPFGMSCRAKRRGKLIDGFFCLIWKKIWLWSCIVFSFHSLHLCFCLNLYTLLKQPDFITCVLLKHPFFLSMKRYSALITRVLVLARPFRRFVWCGASMQERQCYPGVLGKFKESWWERNANLGTWIGVLFNFKELIVLRFHQCFN